MERTDQSSSGRFKICIYKNDNQISRTTITNWKLDESADTLFIETWKKHALPFPLKLGGSILRLIDVHYNWSNPTLHHKAGEKRRRRRYLWYFVRSPIFLWDLCSSNPCELEKLFRRFYPISLWADSRVATVQGCLYLDLRVWNRRHRMKDHNQAKYWATRTPRLSKKKKKLFCGVWGLWWDSSRGFISSLSKKLKKTFWKKKTALLLE